MNKRIPVLGSGDVGSAAAHRLLLGGADVVQADEGAPTAARCSMAFTDASFDCVPTLEGVVGLRMSDADNLAAQYTVLGAVPCTPEGAARRRRDP